MDQSDFIVVGMVRRRIWPRQYGEQEAQRAARLVLRSWRSFGIIC